MTQTSSLYRPARILILAGALLIAYGYLCRFLKIYFFWESRPVGWTLVFIALALVLVGRIKAKRKLRKRTLIEKIGVGILALILLLQLVLLMIFPRTDAYRKALETLSHDEALKNEIGAIKGYSMVPMGQIQISQAKEEKTGTATFYFILKGEIKYRDVRVDLEKDAQKDWEIKGIY